MTLPKSSKLSKSAWRTPTESECANVDRDFLVKDETHIISRVLGYFNGDLTYYKLEPTELTTPGTIHARIWTAEQSVRCITFGAHRTVTSEKDLDTLTCMEDVARTLSASLSEAMKY